MAGVPEVSVFTPQVYQLETTDPIEGGPDGISNQQAKALANRTLWLKNNAVKYFPGELKWLNGKNISFVTTNFPSGLGTGIYLGWAVADGANGTTDMSGRVAVAWGNDFAINTTGGSKDAVVVAHTHNVDSTAATDGGGGVQRFTTGQQNEGGGDFGIQSTGVSGIGKNMQPYRSVLCIQFIG